MKFELYHEKDAGPIVRWLSTKILDLFSAIEMRLYPYADMYTAVWEDEEEDENPIDDDQMVIF